MKIEEAIAKTAGKVRAEYDLGVCVIHWPNGKMSAHPNPMSREAYDAIATRISEFFDAQVQ